MSEAMTDLQSVTTWARATFANASAKLDAEARKIGDYSDEEWAQVKLKLQEGKDLTDAEAEKLRELGRKMMEAIGEGAKQKLNQGLQLLRGGFGRLIAGL
jgi:hypothetical protein